VASKIPGGGGEVKLNYKGIGEMMRSKEVADELESRMRRVQSAIPGSVLQVNTNGKRARAKVINGSDFDEANTGELSRALDLAGGKRGNKVKTNKPRSGR
jgi:hypothetical protein